MFISRTTGASSADSFSSKTSVLPSSSRPRTSTSDSDSSSSDIMSAIRSPWLPYTRSIACRIDTSEVTTGWIWRFVKKATSSTARTLVGSAMARVRTFPVRLIGKTWRRSASWVGTSLSTSGSMSSWDSVTAGTLYCCDRKASSRSSVM
jgi:hypothetical protein